MQFFKYLGAIIITFPWEWMTTRQPTTFLAGFPAIASLVGIGVVVGLANQQDQSDMLPRYLAAAQASYLDEDYEAAEVLYRKAASMDPEKPEPKYGMAKTAEKQEHLGRAWRLMELIAPLDRPGYAKAHFWFAEKLMERYERLKSDLRRLSVETRVLTAKLEDPENKDSANKDIANKDKAEGNKPMADALQQKKLELADAQDQMAKTTDALKQHLAFTVQQQQKNVIAHAFLAQIYLDEIPTAKTKEDGLQLVQKAKQHLKVGNEYSPELMLRYAGLQVATGEVELGKVLAQRAAEIFKKVAIRDDQNTLARIRWANAETIQGNEQQVVSILTEGYQKTKNSLFMQELARYFINQAAAVVDNPDDPNDDLIVFGKRMDYVQRALTVDPTNPNALKTLAILATSKEGKESEEAQKKLLDALASGRATAVVHMIIGTAAIKEKNYDVAKLHLRQALALNKRMPDVLNNLAWVLTMQQPPETKQALELLDNAVELIPQHPEIRETRGQLHAKLENWESALTDLEYALQFFEGRAKIHDTLAECYDKLGDKTMAKTHRQKSLNLKRVEAENSTDANNDG